MKTLKKILVMCMTLVVMVGVTGCVDSDKQDRLLQFINVDLSEAKELETEANDAYTKVKEDENSGDAEFKQFCRIQLFRITKRWLNRQAMWILVNILNLMR